MKKDDSDNNTPSSSDKLVPGEVKKAGEFKVSHGFGTAVLLILIPGNQAYGSGYCSRGHYYSISPPGPGYPCGS